MPRSEPTKLSIDGQTVFDERARRVGRICVGVGDEGVVVLNLRTGKLTATLRLANEFGLAGDRATFELNIDGTKYEADVPGRRSRWRWRTE